MNDVKQPAMQTINKEELGEAIVVGLLSLFLFWVTFTFEEVPEILAQGIGPAIFPRAILVFMFTMAVILGLRAVRMSPEAITAYKPKKPIPKVVFVSAGMLLLFVIGLFTIGAIPSVLAFCAALSLIWGERRYALMGVTFVVFAAFVYLLFVVSLGTTLP